MENKLATFLNSQSSNTNITELRKQFCDIADNDGELVTFLIEKAASNGNGYKMLFDKLFTSEVVLSNETVKKKFEKMLSNAIYIDSEIKSLKISFEKSYDIGKLFFLFLNKNKLTLVSNATTKSNLIDLQDRASNCLVEELKGRLSLCKTQEQEQMCLIACVTKIYEEEKDWPLELKSGIICAVIRKIIYSKSDQEAYNIFRFLFILEDEKTYDTKGNVLPLDKEGKSDLWRFVQKEVYAKKESGTTKTLLSILHENMFNRIPSVLYYAIEGKEYKHDQRISNRIFKALRNYNTAPKNNENYKKFEEDVSRGNQSIEDYIKAKKIEEEKKEAEELIQDLANIKIYENLLLGATETASSQSSNSSEDEMDVVTNKEVVQIEDAQTPAATIIDSLMVIAESMGLLGASAANIDSESIVKAYSNIQTVCPAPGDADRSDIVYNPSKQISKQDAIKILQCNQSISIIKHLFTSRNVEANLRFAMRILNAILAKIDLKDDLNLATQKVLTDLLLTVPHESRSFIKAGFSLELFFEVNSSEKSTSVMSKDQSGKADERKMQTSDDNFLIANFGSQEPTPTLYLVASNNINYDYDINQSNGNPIAVSLDGFIGDDEIGTIDEIKQLIVASSLMRVKELFTNENCLRLVLKIANNEEGIELVEAIVLALRTERGGKGSLASKINSDEKACIGYQKFIELVKQNFPRVAFSDRGSKRGSGSIISSVSSWATDAAKRTHTNKKRSITSTATDDNYDRDDDISIISSDTGYVHSQLSLNEAEQYTHPKSKSK